MSTKVFSTKVFSTTLLGLCGLMTIQSFVSTKAATSIQDALEKEDDSSAQNALDFQKAREQSSEMSVIQSDSVVIAESISTFEDINVFGLRPIKAPVQAKTKPVTLLPAAQSTSGVVIPENPSQVIASTYTNEVTVGQDTHFQIPLLEDYNIPDLAPVLPLKPHPKKQEMHLESLPQQVDISENIQLQALPTSVAQDIDSQTVDFQSIEGTAENTVEKDISVAQENMTNEKSQPSGVMPAEQVLEIPIQPSASSIGTVLLHQVAREQTPSRNEEQPQPQHYAIQRGDTLYKLSRRFSITLNALIETNQIENPDAIFAGNSLIVFSSESDLADDVGNLVQHHTSDSSTYIWPTSGALTSGYGWRWGRMHRGVDIAAPVGTPVGAAAAGVVEFAGWNAGGYGNLIEIRHGDGSLTRYAHNNRLWVQRDQHVIQGELIAEIGSTGRSTGPHLHFEIHQPEQGSVNPLNHLVAEMPKQR